jgi:hypothetical protein
MEVPSLVEEITRVFSECSGIDVVVSAYQGLVYSYSGDFNEAERLAATIDEVVRGGERLVGDARYVVVGGGERALMALSLGDFSLAIEGSRKSVLSCVEPVLRLVSGEEVKCGWCGAVLDLELFKCPRCGSRYPFTSPRCPVCGYRAYVRRCPRCGKLVDYAGRKVRRSPAPIAAFSSTGAALAALLWLLAGATPMAVVLSFVLPTAAGIAMYVASARPG